MALDLRVPKSEVAVDVATVEAPNKTEEYVFYLSQFSRYSGKPETVEELLNSGQSFIPAMRVATSKIVILNLANLAFVREKKKSMERGSRAVYIHFDKSVVLEVQLFEPLPPFHARTLDFFNSKSAFLPFLNEGCKIMVNKKKIVRISET